MITNPITKTVSADPYITYDEDTCFYYATYTANEKVGKNDVSVLQISRSKTLCDVIDAEKIILLRQGQGEHGYYYMWAPEMFKSSDGKWYVYCSGFLQNEIVWNNLKIFVLRSKTNNPFDGFEFVKEFTELSGAFDATVYMHDNGKLYMCYTQTMYSFGYTTHEQRLYIHEMISPIELSKKRAEISKADLPFELSVPTEKINEGPFFINNDGKVFIVYSANGCNNFDYCLGLLEYKGGEICNASSWLKHDQPILYQSETLFGPGHASFFYIQNKKELWCAFHAIIDKNNSTKLFRDRYACVNKVEFDEKGVPFIGKAKKTEIL